MSTEFDRRTFLRRAGLTTVAVAAMQAGVARPPALADASLRDAFAAAYPAAWARIEARRRFMREQLGIELHPDVLPFSNLAAVLPPFVLRPGRAMTLVR